MPQSPPEANCMAGIPKATIIKVLKELSEDLDLWTDRRVKKGQWVAHCCSGMELVAWFALKNGRYEGFDVQDKPRWLFEHGFLYPIEHRMPVLRSRSSPQVRLPNCCISFSDSELQLYRLNVDTKWMSDCMDNSIIDRLRTGAKLHDVYLSNNKEPITDVFRGVDGANALLRYGICKSRDQARKILQQLVAMQELFCVKLEGSEDSVGFTELHRIGADVSFPTSLQQTLVWRIPAAPRHNAFVMPSTWLAARMEHWMNGNDREHGKELLDTLRRFAWAELQENGNSWQVADDDTVEKSLPSGAGADFDVVLEHVVGDSGQVFGSFRATSHVTRVPRQKLQELFLWGGTSEVELATMDDQAEANMTENMLLPSELKEIDNDLEGDEVLQGMKLLQASTRHWDTYPGFKTLQTRIVSVAKSNTTQDHHPGPKNCHKHRDRQKNWLFRRGSKFSSIQQQQDHTPSKNDEAETKKYFLQDHCVSPFGTYMMIQVPIEKPSDDKCCCNKVAKDCCCFCALATTYLIHPMNSGYSQLVVLHQCSRKHSEVNILHSLQQEILNVGRVTKRISRELQKEVLDGAGPQVIDSNTGGDVLIASQSGEEPLHLEQQKFDHSSYKSKLHGPKHMEHHHERSIEDFDLLHVIGRGGYGKVFLGREKSITGKQESHRLVAIKSLRKKELERMHHVARTLTERAILSEIRHPSIVQLYSAFTCDSRVFMVLEYVPGGDLFTRLRAETQIPVPRARMYVAEAVLALEYLHSHGIVYRDLKPENVLIAADGHIKLTDFGLSRGLPTMDALQQLKSKTISGSNTSPRKHSRRPSIEALRQSNSFCGTEIYMAPEVLLQVGHGSAVDWWCVGLFLCELVTGRHPFRVYGDHYKSLQNIVSDKVQPIFFCSVPSMVKNLVEELLQKNPRHRLGSGPNGAEAIKVHRFFTESNMKVKFSVTDDSEELSWADFLKEANGTTVKWDWDRVYRDAVVDYTPKLRNGVDVSHFEPKFTTLQPEISISSEDVGASSTGCWNWCGNGNIGTSQPAVLQGAKVIRSLPRYLFLKRLSLGASKQREAVKGGSKPLNCIPNDDFRSFSYSRPKTPVVRDNAAVSLSELVDLDLGDEENLECKEANSKSANLCKAKVVADPGRVKTSKPVRVLKAISRASSAARTLSKGVRKPVRIIRKRFSS